MPVPSHDSVRAEASAILTRLGVTDLPTTGDLIARSRALRQRVAEERDRSKQLVAEAHALLAALREGRDSDGKTALIKDSKED